MNCVHLKWVAPASRSAGTTVAPLYVLALLETQCGGSMLTGPSGPGLRGFQHGGQVRYPSPSHQKSLLILLAIPVLMINR